MKKGYIVTIDGPAGAGKSTVSRQLAEKLEGKLLDTGAMYRAVAYFAVERAAKTAREFSQITKEIQFDVDLETGNILIDGIDLGHRIRTEEMSKFASYVSQFKSVRSVLTVRQRRIGKKLSQRYPVVVEGRDIGTVVFPKEKFKFFVTASSEVRAKRRYQQLKRHGAKGLTQKKILKEIQKRDSQDMERKIAPLKCPKDAVIVDTSKMGISQVVAFLSTHIQGMLEINK